MEYFKRARKIRLAVFRILDAKASGTRMGRPVSVRFSQINLSLHSALLILFEPIGNFLFFGATDSKLEKEKQSTIEVRAAAERKTRQAQVIPHFCPIPRRKQPSGAARAAQPQPSSLHPRSLAAEGRTRRRSAAESRTTEAGALALPLASPMSLAAV